MAKGKRSSNLFFLFSLITIVFFFNPYTVEPVQAQDIEIVSGDNQTCQIGVPCPQRLVVVVTDTEGTPERGVNVTWSVVSGSASLDEILPTDTDIDGLASNAVTVTGTGAVQIEARTLDDAVIFDLTAAPEQAQGIEIVSGDNQTCQPGVPCPQSLVVEVTGTAGTPEPGVDVSWSVVSGNASLESSSTVTGDDGRTSNTVTVTGTGDVQIEAIALGDAAIFDLNGSSNDTLSSIPGLTPPQRAVADTLDIVCSSGNAGPDLQARCNELTVNAGTDPVTTRNALQQIAYEEVASQGTTAVETQYVQLSNVGARLAALRGGATGVAIKGLALNINNETIPGNLFASLLPEGFTGNSNDVFKRLGIFINGRFNFGDKDTTDREAGFDFDTKGVTAGIDYRFNDNFILGAAFGYANTDVDLDASGGNLDSDVFSGSIYGTYYMAKRFYIDGIGSIGWNGFDLNRNVRYSIQTNDGSGRTNVDQTMKAEPDGSQYSFSVGTGYESNYHAFAFGPYVRVNYTNANIDGYREIASNPSAPGVGLRLEVEDQDVKSLITVLGGQASYAISTQWAVLLPQVRFEWNHEFEDNSRLITARFVEDAGAVPINTPTDDPDRDFFNLGLGVSSVFAHGISAFINYETSLALKHVTSHNITGGVRLEL